MFTRLATAYAFTAFWAFLFAFLYSLQIAPTYTVDALIIPKDNSSNNQLTGLAATTRLLGLSTGGEQSSNFAKFQKYWGSRDVAERLMQRYPKIKMDLFGGNWDKERGGWYTRPHTMRQYIAVPLNALFGVYPSYTPAAQDLADYIKNAMKMETSQATGDAHFTYSSSDAKFGQWFLSVVIRETDKAVREAEQRRDQDFVKFARERLEEETNVAYRDAFTESVRQFEMSNIYSQAGDYFSFQYVEAPNLPVTHSAPRPLLYTVLAFIFANLAASIMVGVLFLWPDSLFARRVDACFDKRCAFLHTKLARVFTQFGR